MTFEELNSNITLKNTVSKEEGSTVVVTIRSILQTRLMQLGSLGRTYGFSAEDKAECLGHIQGYGEAIKDIERIFAVPTRAPRQLESTYGADQQPTKREIK